MRPIVSLLTLAIVTLTGPASADEPDYRGLAFSAGWDDPVSFQSTYAPGVAITISGARNGGRHLVVQNCGSRNAQSLHLEFEAPGFLFAIFENSDSRQGDRDCELYLNLYFKDERGLPENVSAYDVVIYCRRGACVRTDDD